VSEQPNFADRRARFLKYEAPGAVQAYVQRLDREWPARAEITQHIGQQIGNLAGAAPTVLELACGPGRLAATLLAQRPTLRYVGVDISPPFLAFAQAALAPYAARVTLLTVDLAEPTWPTHFATNSNTGRFDAIVSLQALHDVGDEQIIRRLYAQARDLLLPGGCFLNADLVVADGEELPQNPGRRSIPRHLELLRAVGYQEAQCTLAHGGFGVVCGRV
jgi:SAM-dependent methyltransferase